MSQKREELDEVFLSLSKIIVQLKSAVVVGVPTNVLPFPTIGDDPVSEQEVLEVTTNTVAQTLQLPVTVALTQIVHEFFGSSMLSIVGEAIEAREWIDDPRRNRTNKEMTLAFFRRWLKRERGDYGQPVTYTSQTTGTMDRRSRGKAKVALVAQEEKDDPYREFVMKLSAKHVTQAVQEGHIG